MQIEINAPFSLNSTDSEAGMTLLHHLFANFNANPDKAANLFRKMNSLHVRHGGGGFGSSRPAAMARSPMRQHRNSEQ